MHCECQKICKNLTEKKAVNSWAAMLSNISLKNVMENACFWVKGPSGGASSDCSSASNSLRFFFLNQNMNPSLMYS